MKLPISWLRDWVEVEAAPEQVAEALTTRGFYVEAVEPHGRRYPGIVLARVLSASPQGSDVKLEGEVVPTPRGPVATTKPTPPRARDDSRILPSQKLRA